MALSAPTVPLPDPPGDDDDRTLIGLPAAPADPDATILMPRPGGFGAAPDDAGGDDATIRMPMPGGRTAATMAAAPAAAADDAATRTLLNGIPAAGRSAGVAPAREAGPAAGAGAAVPVGAIGTGTATGTAARHAAPPQPAVKLQRLVAGINPLLGAAGVLLALVPRLRSTMSHDDPAGLRQELLDRVAEFEAAAAAQGVPRPKIGAARYLLCSFLDETIAATPWGAGGTWAERNLLQAFHDERSGAQKSFALIERLAREPAGHEDVLELALVCLSLGFEGRWHGVPEGRAELDALSARLLALLRPPGADAAQARTLSLHWQAAAGAARTRLPGLPLPAMLAVAAAGVVVGLLALQSRLDEAVRPVFHRIAAVPQALQAAADAPPAARPRLAPLLQDDIAAGAVAVRDEPLRSVATLPADTLFEPGSARIEPAQEPLVARLAKALQGLPGQVVVVGHVDDAHAASLRFPSGWHLSHERARAVVSRLAQHGIPAQRLQAEGRADAQPVAPNATPDGRARNRRVEVELRLPRPDGGG